MPIASKVLLDEASKNLKNIRKDFVQVSFSFKAARNELPMFILATLSTILTSFRNGKKVGA